MSTLGRWFEGRLISEPPSGAEIITGEDLQDPAIIEAMIHRSSSLGVEFRDDPPLDEPEDDVVDVDVRVAVSRFSRHFAAALSGVALSSLGQGVGVDVGPRNCRFIIRAGVPFTVMLDVDTDDLRRCATRPAAWARDARELGSLRELRTFVWERLYRVHIAPTFDTIRGITGVAPKLVWSGAAEWVGLLSDAAVEYLDPETAKAFLSDRRALFAAERLPGLDGNPIRDAIRWEPTGLDAWPWELHVRETCCITYLLDDRLGRLCQNCPLLPLEDRVALVRERHGVPLGTPGGSASRRATDLGLTMVSRHRRPRP